MKKPIPANILRPTGGAFRHHNDEDDGAPESLRRVSDGAGILNHFEVTMAVDSAPFVQVHDSKDEPEEGAVPVLRLGGFGGTTGEVGSNDTPVPVFHGCWIVLSDELDTYVPSEDTAHFFAIFTEH